MLLEMYRSAEADCERERGKRFEAERQLRYTEELLGLVQLHLDRTREIHSQEVETMWRQYDHMKEKHRREVESHARTETRRLKAVEEGHMWKQWLDNAELEIRELRHDAMAEKMPSREGTPESPAF